ncbi:hypothetical protein DL93DRAFT_2230210 [Clavulina sp. PMI_390]|nr:hypothetical protein DL93DRAFT_2230210 [Clavulina sp. PMI_390]
MVLSPGPVLGSFFIGNILTSMRVLCSYCIEYDARNLYGVYSSLFGAITLQTKLYFIRFPSDSRVLKAMVAFLWLAQLVEVVVSSHKLYAQTIRYHQDFSTKPLPPSSTWEKDYWYSHTIASSFIVQFFYTYRLWSLSRYRIYIGMIATLILVNFAVAVSDNLDNYLGRPRKAAHDLEKAAIDLALAFGVVIILRKRRTGFVQTDRIINWIMLYGVASGVLTSIFALAILVMNLAGHFHNAVGVAMFFGGVYIASALAHLHSRAGLRSELSREHRLPSGGGSWLSSTNIRVSSPNSPSSRKTTELIPTSSSVLLASLYPACPIESRTDGLQVIIEPTDATPSDVTTFEVETEPSASQHPLETAYNQST